MGVAERIAHRRIDIVTAEVAKQHALRVERGEDEWVPWPDVWQALAGEDEAAWRVSSRWDAVATACRDAFRVGRLERKRDGHSHVYRPAREEQS